MAARTQNRPRLAVYLSPSDVASSRGVNVSKILGFIKSGELKAVNMATQAGKLPRWRIAPADLEAFDAARAAVPQSPVTRRPRRKAGAVVEFFCVAFIVGGFITSIGHRIPESALAEWQASFNGSGEVAGL